MANNIIHINDYRPGLHCHTPEMGDREPICPLRLSVRHYGGHYIDSPFELKGRGIKFFQVNSNGTNRYSVTNKALAKLEARYPIKMELLLD